MGDGPRDGSGRVDDLLEVEPDLDRAVSLELCPSDDLGQELDPAGTENEVGHRGAAEDLFAFLLCDAAADPDEEGGSPALEGAHPTEVVVDLLLGLVPNGAGVQEDEVGLFGRRGLRPASAEHEADEPSAVELVHLTAPGLDEDATPMRRRGAGSTARLPR